MNVSRTVSYNFQLKLNYSIYRVITHGTSVLDEHCEIINVNELIPDSELQLPTKLNDSIYNVFRWAFRKKIVPKLTK
jgi:hypothetical protein